jgi:hypothetical protein
VAGINPATSGERNRGFGWINTFANPQGGGAATRPNANFNPAASDLA